MIIVKSEVRIWNSYIVLDGVSKSFRSVEVLKPLSIEFEEG